MVPLLGGCRGEREHDRAPGGEPGGGGPAPQKQAARPKLGPGLDWGDLMPADWHPDVPFTHEGLGEIGEFLLMPYFGACIHAPAPPSQTVRVVRVVTRNGHAYHGELFDTVWVQGTLHVERFRSDAGDPGYHIDAASLGAYRPEG